MLVDVDVDHRSSYSTFFGRSCKLTHCSSTPLQIASQSTQHSTRVAFMYPRMGESKSLPIDFEQYADVFYPLPPLPSFLRDHLDFGSWKAPDGLPDNWAMKHFISKCANENRFKFLENHASTLRREIPCSSVLNKVVAWRKHVILKLAFEDGVIWVARIMFPRCNQDENHKCLGGYLEENFRDRVAGIECEIATLQYVAEATSVPGPKVFGYNPGINQVGGPYMLMEMIDGETIAQRIKWRGGIWGSEVQAILAQMARYLSQISSLRFNSFRRLVFSEDRNLNPRLESFPSGTARSCTTPSAYLMDALDTRIRPQDVKGFLLAKPLGHWTGADYYKKKIIAASIYLRAATVLTPEFTAGPFPLQHPDLNQQNIVLDANGNIKAILDWENAKVVQFESYDIRSRLLLKQWLQVWEGLDWVDDFAYLAFQKVEFDKAPKLSSIHASRIGELGRKLDPLAFLGFVGNVGELIAFLNERFGDQVEAIVSKSLADEIIGARL